MNRNPYEKPLQADKGKEGGSCNRTACQERHAAFCFNRVMNAFYCIRCAREINQIAVRDGIEPFINIPADYHELYRAAFEAAE